MPRCGRIAIGRRLQHAAYSYDDGAADPELKRFSIDHDRDYVFADVAGGS